MRRQFPVILILLLTFLVFLPSLHLGFISDDYFYIRFKTIQETIRFIPGFYHYNPLFLFLLLSLKNSIGPNPFYFHIMALTLHLVNIGFMYKFTQVLIGNKRIAYLSILLFSLFFSHYEVVYWITGINTSLMVLFYLLGLLSYIYFLKSKMIFFLIGYYILFSAAYLTHEFALSLPFVLVAYCILNSKKPVLKKVLQLQIIPVLFALIPIGIKISQGTTQLTPTAFSFFRIPISFIKSFVYLFTMQPYIIDVLPKILILILFLFLFIFVYILSIRTNTTLFLFYFSCIIILLFCITSAPQARYFYLASIPISILIASLMSHIRNKIYLFLILFIVLFSNLLFLTNQYKYWNTARTINKNVHEYLLGNIKKTDVGKQFYFFNMPDSATKGVWIAYVFRNGLPDWMQMEFGIPKNRIHVIMSGNLSVIPRYDSLLNVVYTYNEELKQLNRNEAF